LVNFMRTELGIDDANNINFQNVHRLGRWNDGKPRNIIARFANYSNVRIMLFCLSTYSFCYLYLYICWCM